MFKMKEEIENLIAEYLKEYARTTGKSYSQNLIYVKGWIRMGGARFRVDYFRDMLERLKDRPSHEQENEIREGIQKVIQLADEASASLLQAFRNGEQDSDKNKEFWRSLTALDEKVGKGLKVGRHLKFKVSSGYAHYIVIGVGPQISKVVYVPWMNGHKFEGVVDGEIMTKVAETNVRMHDLFADRLEKQIQNIK